MSRDIRYVQTVIIGGSVEMKKRQSLVEATACIDVHLLKPRHPSTFLLVRCRTRPMPQSTQNCCFDCNNNKKNLRS